MTTTVADDIWAILREVAQRKKNSNKNLKTGKKNYKTAKRNRSKI